MNEDFKTLVQILLVALIVGFIGTSIICIPVFLVILGIIGE